MPNESLKFHDWGTTAC